MPIPKPKNDENHDEFIDRCMGDEIMNDEYPDEIQRFAVCETQWKEKKSMNANRELRYLPFENWELREGDNKPPRLLGYAAVFNQEAEIYGLWREKVSPGAYKKTIKENDIRALWNHNADLVLGRNKNGTLSLVEDDKGLKVEILPPDTQAGRDAVISIKRGDVSQMSISFTIIKREWVSGETSKDLSLCTIREAKLFEVSPVTFPAFENTSIAARTAFVLPNGELDPLEDARRLLRCAERGMSLSNTQRQLLAAAVELYQPYLLEPESEGDDLHSRQSDEPESDLVMQDLSHYSAPERMRQLEKNSRLHGLPL